MAVSGTTLFDLDAIDMIEEAYERAGLESRSGYDMRTARRSLNLMALEWQNRGINLWTVDERSLALQAGVDRYTLDTDIIDLLEHIIRQNVGQGAQQIDYQMNRISVSTYATRSNKLTESRPTEIYVNRQRDAPIITLWPVPEDDSYTLVYWVLRRIQDVGAYTNTFDAPERFLPAMTAGLAYYIAMKKPEGQPRLANLKTVYDEQFQWAAEEDREKASVKVQPRIRRVV